MKIGFNKKKYPEQRCIIDKTPNSQYVYLPNSKIIKIASAFETKVLKKNISKYQFIHKRLNNKGIDGYHFFNYITSMNIPYITTFETYLPRIPELSNVHHSEYTRLEISNRSRVEKYLAILAQDNCKRIIALSKCNYNMQIELLKSFPDIGDKVLNKLIQINPPQKLLINDYKEKDIDRNIIKFVFIGGDFVRKGGVEIVTAFNNIMKDNDFSLELILISDLNKINNYAFKEFQDIENDLSKIKDIIKNTDWIKHYQNLPNNEVIKIIKGSHIGLLPTWADTYGYSVLEFQAAGCPVITTNVRALSEINNDICGWIIEVPTNKYGEVVIRDEQDKDTIRNLIVTQLESTIKSIFLNKDIIQKKSYYSMERIKSEHCPEKYGQNLQNIYYDVFNK